MTLLQKLLRDESGATAIEYALIAVFISVSIVGAAQQIGISLEVPFSTAAAALN